MNDPKLPELPEAAAYCEPNNPHNHDAFAWPGADRKDYHTTHLFTADQMNAHYIKGYEDASAAVEASQPTGDNAEHVGVLERLRGAFGAFGSGPANDADIAALTAAIAALSAPKSEAVDACPCNLPTCVEPWEPGCGLGNSEEHAVVAATQPDSGGQGEAVAQFVKRPHGEGINWLGDKPAHGTLLYTHPPASGAVTELVAAAVELVELVEGPGSLRWQASDGFRFKDTNQWARFYVAAAAAGKS